MPVAKSKATMLYHATYQVRLSSILEHGLLPNCEKAWSISEPDVVYLAQNADEAYCFAEAAEDVPDSVFESGIVVFSVPINGLDVSRIAIDRNCTGGTTYTYCGIIPPELSKIVPPG